MKPIDHFYERGFLKNYPPDVVRVINGSPITIQDILDNKRCRQGRELAARRRVWTPTVKPCFVWTFYNDSRIKMGWWLYVITPKHSYQVSDSALVLQIMKIFPCGHLPMIENLNPWKVAFAENYRRATKKRPTNQGMARARAVISSSGHLIEIISI